MTRDSDQYAWTQRTWLLNYPTLEGHVLVSDRYLPVDIIEGAIRAAFDEPVMAVVKVFGHGYAMGLLAKGNGIAIATQVPPDTDDPAFITAEFKRLHTATQ